MRTSLPPHLASPPSGGEEHELCRKPLSHAYFSEMFQYTGTDALSAPSTFDRMARTR
jgi:hypothetical protein